MTTQMNWINSLNDTNRRSFKETLSISKSGKEIELELKSL